MINGVITALISPFTNDELDEQAFLTHAKRVIDGGSAGVLVSGTSGEYASLSSDEKARAWKAAANLKGEAHVMAGILENSFSAAKELAQTAEQAGVDSILVTPTFFGKPRTPELVAFFEGVAKASNLPIVVYNNPGRAGFNLGLEELSALTHIDTIVGLKDCDRDVGNISDKIREFGTRFDILSGDDDLGWPTLLSGSPGAIWATGNLAPRLPAAIYEAAQNKDIDRGSALHHVIVELCRYWFVGGHPRSLKAGVDEIHGGSSGVRLPLAPLEPLKRAELKRAIELANKATEDILK